jgi:hypothetical protein
VPRAGEKPTLRASVDPATPDAATRWRPKLSELSVTVTPEHPELPQKPVPLTVTWPPVAIGTGATTIAGPAARTVPTTISPLRAARTANITGFTLVTDKLTPVLRARERARSQTWQYTAGWVGSDGEAATAPVPAWPGLRW